VHRHAKDQNEHRTQDVHAALGDKAAAWMAWKRAQLLAPKKMKYGEEAAKLERGFTPEELGRDYQAFLLSTLGRYLRYGGPCLIEGEMAGRTLKFQGILHYKAPWDLRVDILGPMFVPVFGVAVHGEEGFEMDPLDLGGVPQEILREKLYMGIRLLRDFFEGGAAARRWGCLQEGLAASEGRDLERDDVFQ